MHTSGRTYFNTSIETMNKKIITNSLLCLLAFSEVHAAKAVNQDITASPSSKQKGYNLNGLYGYQNFKFNSTSDSNFNRFSGHLNLYMLGSNNIRLREDLNAGLSIYQVDSQVNSSLLLNPNFPSETHQVVRNNSVYGRLLKTIKPYLLLDVVGGLGHNSLSYSTLIAKNTEYQQQGRARSNSDNWFGGVNGIYSHSFRDWKFLGSIGVLYSQVNQDSFNYVFIPNNSTTRVPFLRNKSSFALENAELSYQLKDWVQPFVNAGLIQVLQFENNRSSISGEFLGALPEFNLDQNGYRAGGGLSFKYKQLTLRIEHQYSQRTDVYHSNLTMVSLNVNMA
ncbi:hypothetical protein Lbir_2468 [Legionella birminghamensis]|uniref:Autotransporter domain-containing protein n=2 Tax=Legionella birminghamensis TaxID=28083 RepID=A0A378IA50_9GAMM|nr:hypothetical protein Lbir_2468 [Legionella birminghamensis]STX31451.1 Uncharacterised protein [Legionella birminghamensis]